MTFTRWLAAVLCVAVLCVAAGATVAAEEGAVGTLARFAFDNAEAMPEENIELQGYGDKDKGYNATTGDGDLYASVDGQSYRKLEWTKDGYSGVGIQPAMTGGAKNPWGEGAFFEVRLSTVGWYDLTFSAELGATNKGPRDFQLQMSLDGKSYTDIGEVYSLSDNKVMEKAFHAVPLPKEAQNAETLYIRIAVVGNETVGGEQGFVGTTSGEAAVNGIVINGRYDRELAENAGQASADTTGGEGDAVEIPWLWIGLLALAATVLYFAVRWLIKRKKTTA